MKIIIIIFLSLFWNCKSDKSNTNLINDDTSDSLIKIEESKDIKNQEIDKSLDECDEKFDIFFSRFASDSIFQINKIKYPLKWKYLDDVTDKEFTLEYVEYGSFKYVDFTNDKEAYNNEYDKYSINIISKENYVEYILKGIGNGIYVIYKFELIDKCWYLTEIEDKST